MFKHLLDFSYKRSVIEAFGFYIAYLLLIIILSVLVTSLLSLFTGYEGYNFGFRIGNFIAITTCFTLSIVILYKKNHLRHFGFLIIALISGVFAYIGGGLLGLIPAAFLSTRK